MNDALIKRLEILELRHQQKIAALEAEKKALTAEQDLIEEKLRAREELAKIINIPAESIIIPGLEWL